MVRWAFEIVTRSSGPSDTPESSCWNVTRGTLAASTPCTPPSAPRTGTASATTQACVICPTTGDPMTKPAPPMTSWNHPRPDTMTTVESGRSSVEHKVRPLASATRMLGRNVNVSLTCPSSSPQVRGWRSSSDDRAAVASRAPWTTSIRARVLVAVASARVWARSCPCSMASRYS